MPDKSIILVVDDEIISRHTVEVLLTSEDYTLIFADNGEQALEKALATMPDLMLLDVMMPGMDGFEVCRRLRANPRLAELPVVMVTALDDQKSRLQGLEVGADDFMSKPFNRAELRARVRTITRLNRYRRLIETEEQLVRLANYDSLTGLPNRNLLMERLQRALVHAQRHQQNLTVLALDLDGFQIINNSLGQEIGDQVLCKISHRLTHILAVDTTVARISGDEFIIIAECDYPITILNDIAQQLLNITSKPMILAHQEMIVTASIGISIYPNDGEQAATLLKNAYTAMSRAKVQGKNTYRFFTPEMNKMALKRFMLRNQLHKALERRELCLCYQPQIELSTNQLIGMEALLRWQHPELGLLSPDKFISIAEEVGLIIPIGEWVLRTACQQNKLWQKAGLRPGRVSVNVSSRQFQHPNLLQSIKNVLLDTHLEPRYLELELTESLLMEDEAGAPNSTLTTLSELRAMGIQIAIDDFGTGYSSLSYLKRFPINTLKIDRSFVQDICTNVDDAAITTAIIAMAHSLQMSVVAEGVENI
ncbi:MAG: EAL domain-containing protein, partial [Pseudomonadota bacterium]|nr:EAL domain-containing protein [Pseudomonadota bacterium]